MPGKRVPANKAAWEEASYVAAAIGAAITARQQPSTAVNSQNDAAPEAVFESAAATIEEVRPRAVNQH